MKRLFQPIIYIVGITLSLFACDTAIELDENIPVGSDDLSIISIEPERGLKLDTLTIFGTGFNPIAYQNQVVFTQDITSSFWVNEFGLVTDSIIVRRLRSEIPVSAIEATPTRIKVIVPNIESSGSQKQFGSGPVSIFIGVDTVDSEQSFVLISDRARPRIKGVEPNLGAPGELIEIATENFIPDPDDRRDSTIVRFGNEFVKVDSVIGDELRILVPKVFPGATNIFVGEITTTSDTLWSAQPFSFATLPTPNSPFSVITYNGNAGTELMGVIGEGRVTDSFVQLKDYAVDKPRVEAFFDGGGNAFGVAVDTVSNRMYWLAQNSPSTENGQTQLILGDLQDEIPADVVLAQNSGRYRDLLLIDDELILCGSDIIRYRLGADGRLASSSTVIWSGSASSSITNIKADGNTLYWVDNGTRKVYSGTFTSTAITNVKELFNTDDNLSSPGAIAVDNLTNTLYISDNVDEGLGTRIYKGSTSGDGSLSVFFEDMDEAINVIFDIEIDLVAGFVYFNQTEGDTSEDDGIFRKSVNSTVPTASITPIYRFPNAAYFDF